MSMENVRRARDPILVGTATPRRGGSGRRYDVAITPLFAKGLRVAGLVECHGPSDLQLIRVEENGLELDDDGVVDLLYLTLQSLLRADATYLDDYAEAMWSDGEAFLSDLPAKHRRVAFQRLRAFLGRPTFDDREEK